MHNKPLSIADFKKWLNEQKDLSDFFNLGIEQNDPNDKYIGREVVSKVGEQKLLERIETEDDPNILVRELLEDGGTILSIEDKKVCVETESGSFMIPRFCIKIRKETA